MFYDLGLLEGAGGHSLATMAQTLGYDCVATGCTVVDRLSEACRCSKQVSEARPANLSQGKPLQAPQPLPSAQVQQQLSRLTFKSAEAPLAAAALSTKNEIAYSYDVLAMQPQSDPVLAQACSRLDVDIISMDLSVRLPFQLRHATVVPALQRGIFFEIAYAPTLRDEATRRNLFSNASTLIQATRGKGIVISSAARDAFELRGPYDAVNLGVLFGLTEVQAKAALTSNPASVLAHAQRRKAHNGSFVVESLSAFDNR